MKEHRAHRHPSICLYAVPNKKYIASGPMARVSAFSEELVKNSDNVVIRGGVLSKIVSSIRSTKCEILYIESSTNRLRMVDYLCLAMLTHKNGMVVVYIRDIYHELFPEQYMGFFNRIRTILHRVTDIYFSYISDYLAFPTKEMASRSKIASGNTSIFALPPGCRLLYRESQLPSLSASRLSDIKFINVGGFGYKYSGLDMYLDYIEKSSLDATYYIITRHVDLVNKALIDRGLSRRSKIKLLSLSQDQVFQLIEEENITYAFHSRPRNEYDDLTYPIKIFDYLSIMLPVISERHVPIVLLYGSSYPLFCNLDDARNIDRKLEKFLTAKHYEKLLSAMYGVAVANTYSQRVEKIRDVYHREHSDE